jgi:hypothetical protein
MLKRLTFKEIIFETDENDRLDKLSDEYKLSLIEFRRQNENCFHIVQELGPDILIALNQFRDSLVLSIKKQSWQGNYRQHFLTTQ